VDCVHHTPLDIRGPLWVAQQCKLAQCEEGDPGEFTAPFYLGFYTRGRSQIVSLLTKEFVGSIQVLLSMIDFNNPVATMNGIGRVPYLGVSGSLGHTS